MKKSELISVRRDDIRIDPTAKAIWRNIEHSSFFFESVAKFGHYTNPTAYKKRGRIFILNNIPSVEVFLQSQEAEILVELTDIDEADVPHFLIAFLNKEHKQPRTAAELIKLFLNYTKSGEGKKWYNDYPDSKDKEEIISKVFGISVPSVKAYLHLIQPGREKYLEMLKDTKSHSLHEVYQESRNNEKKDKSSTNSPTPAHSTQNSGAPGRVVSAGVANAFEITSDSSSVRSSMSPGEVPLNRAAVIAVDENAFDKDVLRHEAQRVDDSEQLFVERVVAYLSNGSQLQLMGKIDLKAKELSIKTTDHFKKCSDGTWFIPSMFGPVSIDIDLKDPIQSSALLFETAPKQ